MEDDGTSWTAAVTVDSAWSEQSLPLASFVPAVACCCRRAFPASGTTGWGRRRAARLERTDSRLDHVERLQLSLRREDGGTVSPGSYGVEVESIVLRWNSASTSGPSGPRM